MGRKGVTATADSIDSEGKDSNCARHQELWGP